MSDLTNATYLSLLPENLRADVECICLGQVFDELMLNIRAKTPYIWFFSRINTLTSTELDLLAKELHVDVYSSDWDLIKKRNACINSIKWHVYKGTPWMLEDFMQQIYGDLSLTEWWEYGGLSYHFKVVLNLINNANNIEVLKRLAQAVKTYKNIRSKLDDMEIENLSKCDQKFLAFTKTECEKLTLSNLYVGSST